MPNKPYFSTRAENEAMTEFYRDMSHEDALALISKKMAMYNGMLDVTCYHNIERVSDEWMYVYYAKHEGLELGLFAMYYYSAVTDGIELYSFYAVRTLTEETKENLQKRKDGMKRATKACDLSLGRHDTKRKYSKMNVSQLNRNLMSRSLSIKGKKADKIRRLVEHEIHK